jgi:Sulfatase
MKRAARVFLYPTVSAAGVFTVPGLQYVAWIIAGIAAFGLGICVGVYEGRAPDILFALSVIGTTWALVAFGTRRPLFALVFTTALVTFIFLVSKAKQDAMNVTLHAYDIIFYLGSWSTVTFLIKNHPSHVIGFALGLVAIALVSVVAFRIDRARLRRVLSAIVAACFAFGALAAASARSERYRTELFFGESYVSLFVSTLPDAMSVVWSGGLFEAAPLAPNPNFAMPGACHTVASPPNIILIHQESAVPPSHFPALSYDRGIDPFFRSHDDKLHKLRVETFGGASWLTEFSILTGLSSYSFGNMRTFVQVIAAGKVHDALPQVLDRCGYHNLMIYPMLRNFASNGRFYDKIGFHKLIDGKDQKATQAAERDRFYYANALDEMNRHFRHSSQPIFVYILTQATHGSYDFTYMPELSVAGGGPGTDAGVHEYLRRLGMAVMDYAYLKAELARRFPDRPFLIVNYGDHQPDVTRNLLGSAKHSGILSIDQHPKAFVTYYSTDTIGYRPPALPALEYVDVPYLGTVLLEAAGLPLPDSYQERKRLMWLCNGAYHDCNQKADILRFHRRLMNSGLMEPM